MKSAIFLVLASMSVAFMASCGLVETDVDLPSRGPLGDFGSTAWSLLLLVIAAVVLLRLRLRIPEEARWNHEYVLPPEAMLRRQGIYPLLGLLGLLVVSVGLAVVYVPAGLQGLVDWITTGGLKEPWAIFLALVSVTGILSEIYLGIAFVSSFLLFAQAAPPVPKWLETLAWIVFIISAILLEIASFPVIFWLIVLALLGSILAILAGSWLLWVSNPNNPVRVWFCTYIAPYFWTPYEVLWGTVWRCLKWGWVGWWEWEVWWFTKAYEVLKEIWGWITYPVRVVSTQVQTIVRRVQQFVNQYVPSWAQGFVNWLADTMVEFVDVVETVVVVIVTIVYVTVLVLLGVITLIIFVAFAILVVLLVEKLVCLVWLLIVASLSWTLLWLWTIPIGFLRILFAN